MSLTKQEFNELVAKAGVGELTDEEAAALEPYRVRNAIILAAGACRRFEPISFDFPKSLTLVRGEVLIERQIRQLLSVGISDITIVIGFMKEKFEYLGEKYGVSFVEAPEYINTNNIVSLSLAADRLGGTYILLGDHYFTVNPFERYVFRSYYATTLTASDDVWVMETDPDGVVTDMVMSADGGEKLQGPCYVDAETGAALREAIEETRKDWHNDAKTWEFAWYLHRDTVNIVTRYFPEGVLNSFDTMDELHDFDDSYLIHVKSPAMDNICNYLNCTYEDLHDFEPLLAGLTNYSVVFTVKGHRYVYRHPIGYGVLDFNRKIEVEANSAARDCGVDPTFIYEDPEVGWKLSHYVEGAHIIDRENTDDCIAAAKLMGKFQRATKGISVDLEYDRWDLSCDYEKRIRSRGYQFDERAQSYFERMYKLAAYVKADNYPKVLSHNDFWYANILWGADGSLSIIDWEYAAMADWMSDIAGHSDSYYISVPLEDLEFGRGPLRAFLQREETPEEWRHFVALEVLCGWKTNMWALDFITGNDANTDWDIDNWLQLGWDFFDLHLDNVLAMYENA